MLFIICRLGVCSKYLEMDITFPEDMTDRYGDMVAKHVTVVVDKFRRVFFVDDAIETLKVCWRFFHVHWKRLFRLKTGKEPGVKTLVNLQNVTCDLGDLTFVGRTSGGC